MKNILVMLGLLLSIGAFAQDEIYYADGKMEEGKVLEVEKSYLVIRNEEGIKLQVPRIEIAMVVYENGSFEIYNKNYEKRSSQTKKQSQTGGNLSSQSKVENPNQLKLNLAAIMLGNAEISYQRKLTNVIALEFPFAFGWESGQEAYYFRKKYSFGINLLFYPLKPTSAVQFYVGAGFEGGNAFVSDDLFSDFYYQSPSPYGNGYNYILPFNGFGFYSNYVNLGARAGLTFMVNKSFGFGAEGGLGLRSFVGPQDFFMPYANFNFNLQYHF